MGPGEAGSWLEPGWGILGRCGQEPRAVGGFVKTWSGGAVQSLGWVRKGGDMMKGICREHTVRCFSLKKSPFILASG